MLDRERLARPSVEVAPLLLGARLVSTVDDVLVAVEITEVEAYLGEHDPGSHAFRGLTERNRVMFGPAGHLYVYFTYGMHWCANVVTGTEGSASGCLVRAGRVVEGAEQARQRRPAAARDRDLARGPARLAQALGITGTLGGHDLAHDPVRLELPDHPVTGFRTGPRVGVSGPGGDGDTYPWRYWVPGEPTVSAYRRSQPRKDRHGRH
ncbi:DNA-3-methyladenine glycosylase [Propionibacteriaceae bacterium Y1923]|uniref:DNA-3-methyladenine glycosylase n=1 Tax=Aestuariimicrobium sp. Y1814 TaxID=3418742 RepID=UPI003C24D376